MRIDEIVQRPTVFYKGYNPGDTRRISTGHTYWDSMLFVSSNPNSAKMYGSHLRVFHASPDAKIVYEGTKPFISLAKGLNIRGMNLLTFSAEVVKRAEAAGYDAVWFKMQGDVGTAIIHPEKFIEQTQDENAAQTRYVIKQDGTYRTFTGNGKKWSMRETDGEIFLGYDAVMAKIAELKSINPKLRCFSQEV